MGDYSARVLDAPGSVGPHAEHVSALVLDAPRRCGRWVPRGKAFFVYISNVYDNLPTDEVATSTVGPTRWSCARICGTRTR